MLEKSKGNTFADTVKIPKDSILAVASIIESQLTVINVSHTKVGSAYNCTSSVNDIDIQVELSDVIKHFAPTASKKSDTIEKLARVCVKNYFSDLGFEVAQAGINVFVCVPFEGNRYQVDLEIIYHINDIKEFHIHNIPPGSKYKGLHKQILLSLLAKKQGFLYSAWEGLYYRTDENKKGEFVTRSFSEISKILTGKYGANRINCVENILNSLPYSQSVALLSEVEQDKNWVVE